MAPLPPAAQGMELFIHFHVTLTCTSKFVAGLPAPRNRLAEMMAERSSIDESLARSSGQSGGPLALAGLDKDKKSSKVLNSTDQHGPYSQLLIHFQFEQLGSTKSSSSESSASSDADLDPTPTASTASKANGQAVDKDVLATAITIKPAADKGKLMQDEDRSKGSVPLILYWKYLASFGIIIL
jgi:hypothetical protein